MKSKEIRQKNATALWIITELLYKNEVRVHLVMIEVKQLLDEVFVNTLTEEVMFLVFASLLTGSNTKRTNPAREPWVYLTWLLFIV